MAATDDIVARARADLQRAVAQADRARATLATAEAEISDLTAFLRTLDRYAGPLENGGENTNKSEHRRNESRGIGHPGSRGRALVDAAIEAIRTAGKPLPIGALLDAVLAAGHTLGGSDQKSNLAGYLSRDPRVASRGRSVGWDLVETEEAAPEPASGEAASSINEGGTDERSTLTVPGRFDL